MEFKIELTEFPSEVHKRIYCEAREIIPLENSLADITDNEIKASCEDFYSFVMEMFSDMYDNPEEYSLPVYELENYLAGRKVNGVKRKYPSKTKNIISHAINAPGRYMATLANMVYMGKLKDDVLVLDEETLVEINRRVNTSISPITLDKRLEALARLGLVHTDKGFESVNHPKMFRVMDILLQKTKGKFSGFDYYLFEKLDFRNLTKSYKPTYKDYILPLISERRDMAFKLHDLVKECGCRDVINTFLKIEYKYKGLQVATLDTSDNRINLRVTEVYGTDDHELFNRRLAKENAEFQKYAQRHVWRCTGCATTHLGAFVEILGHWSRVCGGGQIGFLWNNPTEEDMDKIRFFINTRCDIIDEIKKNKIED